MKCPRCGHEEDKVVDSRPSQDGRAIRRRRECLACSERFTTYEYVEQGSITVIKSDGRREPFDRHKVVTGIKLACNKRPVSSEHIQTMVEEVEAYCHSLSTNEVLSATIGEAVMKKLREVDEVAYVRFASVYRDFKDMDEFLDELKKLRRQRPSSRERGGQ